MEKSGYIVMTNRDKKKLDEISRLLMAIGFDIDEYAKTIKELKDENEELKREIAFIKEDYARSKKDMSELVETSMKTIQTNVAKATEKQTTDIQKQINTFLYKGGKIDEKY